MAIPLEMKQLIGIPYDINSSPRIDLPEGTHSVDCRLLWQQYYHFRFGVTIPVGMWSKEAFQDESLFRFVDPKERLIEADTFFFGEKDKPPKSFHLAVFSGEFQNNQPLLIHASSYNGRQVTLETLEKILKTPQYVEIKGIKRLRQDLFQSHILPVVYNSAK